MLAFVGVLPWWGMVAGAHQPYESSAQARLEGEGIELTLTASLEIAGLLADKLPGTGNPQESGNPQASMQQVCAGLYEVAQDGRVLSPERMFYQEREGEAVFSLMYPPAGPGELRFRARYLDQLPPGYGGALRVLADSGKILGFQQRLAKGEGHNVLAVRLKPDAAQAGAEVKETSSAPSLPAALPPAIDLKPRRKNVMLSTPAALGLVAVMAWLLVRNKPKRRSHV